MTSSYDYDLIVIGAGIAGMVSAVTACGLGKRVAVVEKNKLGGNCTNTTCIPSKALIRLGHAGNELSQLSRLGLVMGGVQNFRKRNIMPHINRIVERAYAKDLPETFEAMGIRIFSGVASFLIRTALPLATKPSAPQSLSSLPARRRLFQPYRVWRVWII